MACNGWGNYVGNYDGDDNAQKPELGEGGEGVGGEAGGEGAEVEAGDG